MTADGLTVWLRWLTLTGTFVFGGLVSTSADPIVFRGGSAGAGQIDTSKGRATFRTPLSAPEGVSTFAGTFSGPPGAEGEASVTLNLSTSNFPNRFAASGELLTFTSFGTGIIANACSCIDFFLPEPQMFTFVNRLQVDIDRLDGHVTPILFHFLGGIENNQGFTIFNETFANFDGPHIEPGVLHTVRHSGLLHPGNYSLDQRASMFQVSHESFPDRRGRVFWDTEFTLTPTQIPAVPEPSTLMLLGTAVIGMAGREWRRRKHRTMQYPFSFSPTATREPSRTPPLL
jgi:hypothetical protein